MSEKPYNTKRPYGGGAQPVYDNPETVATVYDSVVTVDDTPVQVKKTEKPRRRARVTRDTASRLMTRLSNMDLPVGAIVKVEINIPSSSLMDTWVTDPYSDGQAAYSLVRREEQVRFNFEVDADPR